MIIADAKTETDDYPSPLWFKVSYMETGDEVTDALICIQKVLAKFNLSNEQKVNILEFCKPIEVKC